MRLWVCKQQSDCLPSSDEKVLAEIRGLRVWGECDVRVRPVFRGVARLPLEVGHFPSLASFGIDIKRLGLTGMGPTLEKSGRKSANPVAWTLWIRPLKSWRISSGVMASHFLVAVASAWSYTANALTSKSLKGSSPIPRKADRIVSSFPDGAKSNPTVKLPDLSPSVRV